MIAFAIAASIARTPSCPKWLAYTLYGTAAAISLSRISSYHHWASDVYFGPSLGC